MRTILCTSIFMFMILGTSCGRNKGHQNAPLYPSREAGIDRQFEVSVSLTGLALHRHQTLEVDVTNQPDVVPSADKALLPTCLGPLPSDFELGEASCKDDPKRTTPIKAKHAHQVCTGRPGMVDVAASENLALTDCYVAKLDIYKFNPPLAARLSP